MMVDLTNEELPSIEGGDFIIVPCNPWEPDYPLGGTPPYNPFPMPNPGCW
jgi:hypothetical protein